MRLWQKHLRQRQREFVQQQTPSKLAPRTDLAPHITWASLLRPLMAAIADNWWHISSSVSDIDAHVSVRRCSGITAA